MSTPHIEAKSGEIAETILLPGDPLRAKFIAENYLDDFVQFNRVRNMFGYTGYYKGKRVSVMGTGMGMPSIGIYAFELIKFYDVKRLIRVGSAGTVQPDMQIKDIVIAQGASTNSSFSKQYRLRGEIAALSDYGLLSDAVNRAKELNLPYHVGNILSSDTFYDSEIKSWKKWADMGVLCIEMEAYALFLTAAALHASALAICTISDSIVTGENISHEDREKSLRQMIELALDIA
ncbi:MAG TPA: purine-nucleoside phosphorylase [Saprospiraceae bacterium]|jgi:purine-nucleoside phosphorylase|nr:purine-nucleoside phosphorylase [Saprospiraceae bacterium]HRO07284.1 purine-nucleoside phosphorylase [Saprospiraceae bacterium]HRO73949.1 purine-nucleoside phosphorylase [Saprospiraceae bacterium]HRP40567.1 purine-nucleoside phosphorylase [Saprospiraceae bacterium]